MKKILFSITMLATCSCQAEIYKCIDSNKKIHYQDQECTYIKGKLSAYKPSGGYEKRDPTAVKNEIIDIQNKANQNEYYGYSGRRYESNELIDNERQKEYEKQKSWNDLGLVGVTYNKSPNTYFNTQFRR